MDNRLVVKALREQSGQPPARSFHLESDDLRPSSPGKQRRARRSAEVLCFCTRVTSTRRLAWRRDSREPFETLATT
jgi:hypothetical protein